MSTIINFSRTPLPNTQFEGDIDDFIDLIVAHLEGTLENGAITGQVGGSEPLADIGFWFNEVFYTWNELAGKYLPIPLLAGRVYNDVVYNTFLQSSATADRTLTLPDKDGTLATTDEVVVKNPTVTLGGTTLALNGFLNSWFYHVLIANITNISLAPLVDGQVVELWIEAPASTSFTVAWTPLIHWMGGAAPVQSTSGAGVRTIDHYKVWRVGDIILGEQVQGAEITIASSPDSVAPTIVAFNGSVATIILTASEPVRGGDLVESDFVVKKNGNTQTINTATASGKLITLILDNAFIKADLIQVQYLNVAHTVKDVYGNNLAAFALTTVVNGSNATGTGAGGFGGQNGPHGAIP